MPVSLSSSCAGKYLNFACWVIFHDFCRLLTFFKINFFRKFFREHYQSYGDVFSYFFANCIGLDKQNFERKIVTIFLPISFNICFGCSKELSH